MDQNSVPTILPVYAQSQSAPQQLQQAVGSLNFVPPKPEAPILPPMPETTTVPETVQPEIQKTVETISPQAQPATQVPAQQTQTIAPTQSTQTPQIVNMATKKAELKKIPHPADKLTSLADLEEEEFIEKVEEAHGLK